MLESDFLDMNQMNIQCDESISVLSDSNVRLNGIRDVYKAANKTKCKGVASISFYKHCDRIVTLIGAIIEANDSDIMDNKTLKSFLTEGLVLDGRVILPSKRRAAENERREREAADECESRSHGVSPEEKHYWRHEYRCHKQAADSYRREKEFWESRERMFDEINNSTQNLFSDSTSRRDAVDSGINSLSTEFVEKKCTFKFNDSWKDGFENLYKKVSIEDKCKEQWKDENGVYKLDVLKAIYDNKLKGLTATEVEAFTATLKELHPEAQKRVTGHVAASDADIKGLVQGLVKSTGGGGKTGVGVYNTLTAKDNSAKKLAGFKLAKDAGMAAATWAGTFWYKGFARNAMKGTKKGIQRGIGVGIGNANRTLYKGGSYIKSISKASDDLTNVGFKEIVRRTVEYEHNSYKMENAYETAKAARNAVLKEANELDDFVVDDFEAFIHESAATRKAADKAAIAAGEATDLSNFKVGVKWFGVVADVVFSGVDNFAEQKQAQKSGIEMSNGRVFAETAIEATTNVVIGAASNIVSGIVIGGGAALLGLSAPAVAVAAGAAVAVWGINEYFKGKTGKNLGEYLSDSVCDMVGIK
ncbi:hypothetical protein [Butyrivibrio sp. AE2005]|uniref:hypothetical protein n=1 Tax=Butyrivibrio sp. AE2005 TaxID=1496722 RepID=UPI00047BEE73|nr:hypothetical protein [Butyrivibrio sp. AE2005]